MSRSTRPAYSWLRVALLCSTAFVLADTSAALARVGVTSATNGDPIGKPPQEAERVLRIGIDVQANEAITTGPNDRAHLVFLDGTSLTVGPNAQLTIDKFVYDPNTRTGELAVNASKGVLRLVGGKISKTNDIVITTPSSTIGVRGGMALLVVGPNSTVSTFMFGKHLRVAAQGQVLTRLAGAHERSEQRVAIALVDRTPNAREPVDEPVERVDSVAFANVGRSLPRQFDCGHEASEAVGLIGPHACFEPANLVVVEHVDGRRIETD